MAEAKSNARLSREQQITHVDAWKASGLTQVEYCEMESLSVKTFHNWVAKWKAAKDTAEKLGKGMEFMANWQGDKPPETKSKALQQDPLQDAQNQIRALEFQRDELLGKLEDAEIKIKSRSPSGPHHP